jgi:tRNA threonylcarbamoyladenosine biosynthesis protein TsaE
MFFMKKFEFCIQELENLVEEFFLPKLKTKKIFAFYGPLGVGKTTIIRRILESCNVVEKITSPTFSYLKIYSVSDGRHFNHFDLYRLSSLQSFLELGFDEYLNKESFCFVEWPEIIQDLLEGQEVKKFVLRVDIEYVDRDDSSRLLSVK